jgi:hypothetical protein
MRGSVRTAMVGIRIVWMTVSQARVDVFVRMWLTRRLTSIMAVLMMHVMPVRRARARLGNARARAARSNAARDRPP